MKTKNKNKPKNQKQNPKGDNIIRVPRTAGLTMAMRQYNLESDPKQRNKLYESTIDRILGRYIEDGYMLNGQVMSVDQVSNYLQIPVTRVIKASTRVIRSMSMIGDGEKGLDDLYRALLALGVNGALADRGRALKQVQVLENDQNGTYTPFLTSALNQALKNLMDSNKPIMDLVKILTPSDPSVVINNQQNQALQNNQYMGTNEAVRLIDDRRGTPLLDNEEAQKQLAQNNLADPLIPEIIATRQQGYRAGGESLVNLERNPDSPKPKKIPKHQTRREDEGEIIDI